MSANDSPSGTYPAVRVLHKKRRVYYIEFDFGVYKYEYFVVPLVSDLNCFFLCTGGELLLMCSKGNCLSFGRCTMCTTT